MPRVSHALLVYYVVIRTNARPAERKKTIARRKQYEDDPPSIACHGGVRDAVSRRKISPNPNVG